MVEELGGLGLVVVGEAVKDFWGEFRRRWRVGFESVGEGWLGLFVWMVASRERLWRGFRWVRRSWVRFWRIVVWVAKVRKGTSLVRL